MRTEKNARKIFSGMVIALSPILYLASFPPAMIMIKQWPATSPIVETLYAPAEWFYDDSGLRMDWYLDPWKNWAVNQRKSSRK